MRSIAKFGIVALFGLLAACGDSFEEQALIGAGAGAGVAAVTDSDVAAGALVGGAANVAYCSQYPENC